MPHFLPSIRDVGVYEAWARVEAAARSQEDYLYADNRTRFRLEEDDEVITATDIQLQQRGETTYLTSASGTRAAVSLPLPVVRAVLGAMSELVPLRVLRQRVTASADALEQLLGATLGRVVFCPLAVYGLEKRVSGLEITRFAVSPYEVSRPYWLNMAVVRERCVSELDAVDSPAALCAWLQSLHASALLGEGGNSFYLPLSPIARSGVHPGKLLEDPTVLEQTARGIRIVSGPRVDAAWVGGRAYNELLAESAGSELRGVETSLASQTGTNAKVEPEPGEARARHVRGVPWGRLVEAYAHDEPTCRRWFLPSRPLMAEHWTTLFIALGSARVAADKGELEATCRALALFHQRFIQLHPFHCGNQSVAMNLVGALLTRAGAVGIPHLILDHLALQLSADAYSRVFARAVRYYARAHLGIVERYRALAEDRERVMDLFERLRDATTDQGRTQLRAAPDAASAALLVE